MYKNILLGVDTQLKNEKALKEEFRQDKRPKRHRRNKRSEFD